MARASLPGPRSQTLLRSSRQGESPGLCPLGLPEAEAQGQEGPSQVSWGDSGLFAPGPRVCPPHQVRAEERTLTKQAVWTRPHSPSFTKKPAEAVHPQGPATPVTAF